MMTESGRRSEIRRQEATVEMTTSLFSTSLGIRLISTEYWHPIRKMQQKKLAQ
jgi:hypothetical protein